METIGVFADKTNQHQGILLDDDDDELLVEGDEAFALSKKLQDRRMKAKNRRRRRSSARFLNLGTEDDEQKPISSANLGEVYQNAIRMNAENKINAANSWNLNLIDHLDQFVSTSSSNGREEDAGVSSIRDNLQQLSLESDDAVVNFTKASCTLDASVKIYSYRVDDVHLTSYKVLANLNRTETGKNKKKDDSATKPKNVRNEEASNTSEKRKVSETETLEQNLGEFCKSTCTLYTHQSFSISFILTSASIDQPTLISQNLTRPLILIRFFTRCPRHLMKVVQRDSYWPTLEFPTRVAILFLILH